MPRQRNRFIDFDASSAADQVYDDALDAAQNSVKRALKEHGIEFDTQLQNELDEAVIEIADLLHNTIESFVLDILSEPLTDRLSG